MEDIKKICILGTDARSLKIRELYSSEKNKIVDYEDADYVIAPIPFSRDNVKINGEILECDELISVLKNKSKILFTGALSSDMKQKLKQNNVVFYDMFDFEEVAVLNAIPTAEGAIATAMEITDFTLCNSMVLVLGYGRIGKVLSKMLNGIGCKVYCSARNKKDIAMIEAMGYNSINTSDISNILTDVDVIFNTIPNVVLDEDKLVKTKKDCCIIDLASPPGGVDFVKANELGKNVVWALAVPSKVAPMSAAIYLKNSIDNVIYNK